jgi:uroporphyrinogen-III synthase
MTMGIGEGDGALAGRRVVITRPSHQQDELAGALCAAGAKVVRLPLIDIVEVRDGLEDLRGELADADAVAWLVVSSPNGARVVAALHQEGCAMPPVAAIGESTARAIGHDVDFVSRRANAASLVEEFPTGDGRVVVVQGARADTTLVDGLTAKGWDVTRCDVYATVDTEPSADDLARAASADAIVFASGSAAENWSRLVGAGFAGVVVVIGPVTKIAAESVGLRVDAMATEPSVEGLVAVLASTLSP